MHPELESIFDMRGQVALITGGAIHFGFDIACVLGAAGCHLAITSRDEERARRSADELRSRYEVDVLPFAMDVADATQVADVVRRVHDWKQRIDILVNNAGGGSIKGQCHLFERETQAIDRLIAVNLNGTLYCCREVGRIMREQGRGKIINIASIAGILGRDRRMYARSGMASQPVDYAAAKAGVIGMTRDLAALLGPHGVCVNSISPGGFNRDLPETFVRDYCDRTPLGRMGRDGIDLKGAVLFLASSASDYVTGHDLVVDGGFTAWQ
ncbi:MAG: SDR family oxidoreductase [Planctomycetes bacterium]|nr:SDR family oxidoreductase [Planctomycetota bacterium]